MMTKDDNPLGLKGFEFVEFTGPDPAAFVDIFESLGFTDTATHRSKNMRRYAQGDINFCLNMDAVGQVAHFREHDGPSANAVGFRVAGADKAVKLAVERDATPVEGKAGPAERNVPAVEGIGGTNLSLVDRRSATTISFCISGN
jgi:4-hydroxyphenylpyruvate dioxygenase